MPTYTMRCNSCGHHENFDLPMSRVSELNDISCKKCDTSDKMSRDYSTIIMYSDGGKWDWDSSNHWSKGKTVADVAGVLAGTLDP
jgi:hypothetical protein